MKVIAAGMSKTGTKTMCAALNILGYEVYDFMENFYFLGDDWVKIIREGAKVEDFRRMYKDVDAVTDSPCYFYWDEMLEAFPDAKMQTWLECNILRDIGLTPIPLQYFFLDGKSYKEIVLTIRDEESWYKSITKQVSALSNDMRLIALWKFFRFRTAVFSLFGDRGKWPWSTVRPYEEEALKRLYRKHNRRILQNAPKDKLLVYEVNQGWKPLCDFLGVQVPNRNFPYKNKGASVLDDLRREDKIMRRLVTELNVTLAVLMILLCIAIYVLFTSESVANFFWSVN